MSLLFPVCFTVGASVLFCVSSVLCPSGNPVSATVTFYLFALPVIRKMAGWKDFELKRISAKVKVLVNR